GAGGMSPIEFLDVVQAIKSNSQLHPKYIVLDASILFRGGMERFEHALRTRWTNRGKNFWLAWLTVNHLSPAQKRSFLHEYVLNTLRLGQAGMWLLDDAKTWPKI